MTDRLDQARDDFSRSIGFLLQRAHHRFRADVVVALAGSGLNPGQLAIVAALASVNDLSQRDLTRLTNIEKSSMVIFLNQLEASGWVERRPHPRDRRAHAIHLGDAARARLGPVGERLDQVEARLLQPLSTQERDQLADLLRRIAPD